MSKHNKQKKRLRQVERAIDRIKTIQEKHPGKDVEKLKNLEKEKRVLTKETRKAGIINTNKYQRKQEIKSKLKNIITRFKLRYM
jgi:hypothetical protein